jgi:hypothetical protein
MVDLLSNLDSHIKDIDEWDMRMGRYRWTLSIQYIGASHAG